MLVRSIVPSDWETGNAVATLIQYPFTQSLADGPLCTKQIGMEGKHFSFRRTQFVAFSIHRGRQPVGECNADAIRKQLKTAN
jgi:hypothetical protein